MFARLLAKISVDSFSDPLNLRDTCFCLLQVQCLHVVPKFCVFRPELLQELLVCLANRFDLEQTIDILEWDASRFRDQEKYEYYAKKHHRGKEVVDPVSHGEKHLRSKSCDSMTCASVTVLVMLFGYALLHEVPEPVARGCRGLTKRSVRD